MGIRLPIRKHYLSLLMALLLGMSVVFILVNGLMAGTAGSLDSSYKSASLSTAFPGQTIQYTINISNSSSITTTTTLTDTLPLALTYTPDSLTSTISEGTIGGYSYSNGVITWTGTLSGYGSANIFYKAVLTDTLLSGEIVTNTVLINDGNTEFERLAATDIITTANIHMPIIFRSVPTPDLFPIIRERTINSWTLYWSVNASDITGYQLQEATTTDFTNAVTLNLGPVASFDVIKNASTITNYCYRVRALANSIYGGWSEIRCVVGDYYDEFDNPASGWSIRRQDTDDVENFTLYQNSNLVLKIGGRWDYAIASPLAKAPAPPYHIQTRVIFGGGVDNLHTYGIIFGGNYNGGPCPDPTYSTCFNGYYRLNVLWYGPSNNLRFELKRIDGHDPVDNGGVGIALIPFRTASIGNSQGYNTWAVDVYPDGTINIFAEGKLVGTAKDSTYINAPYFGVFASTDEYAGSEPTFDYYGVSALPTP